jgi:hypothetical protein
MPPPTLDPDDLAEIDWLAERVRAFLGEEWEAIDDLIDYPSLEAILFQLEAMAGIIRGTA